MIFSFALLFSVGSVAVEEGWRYKETFELQVGSSSAVLNTKNFHIEMDKKLGAFDFALSRSTLFGGTLDRSTVLYLLRLLPVFVSFDGEIWCKEDVQLDSELLMKAIDQKWKPNRHFLPNELIFISGFCKRENEQVFADDVHEYVKCEVAGMPSALLRRSVDLISSDKNTYRNFLYMYGALPNVWPTCHLMGRHNTHPQFLAAHIKRCFPKSKPTESVFSSGNGYEKILEAHNVLDEIDQKREQSKQDLLKNISRAVDDVEGFEQEYCRIIAEARNSILAKTEASNKYTCAELLVVDFMHDHRVRNLLQERIKAVGISCGQEYAKSKFPYLITLCSMAPELPCLSMLYQLTSSYDTLGMMVLMRGSRIPCGACSPMLVRECEEGGVFSELIGKKPVKLSVSCRNIYERKTGMIPYQNLHRSTRTDLSRDVFSINGSYNTASFTVFSKEGFSRIFVPFGQWKRVMPFK